MNTHRARKRFGQNFLHDAGTIQRIVHAIAPQPGEHLLEIGPGQAALTLPLLDMAGHLQVIELDRDLIEPLQQKCAGHGELLIHQGDALKFDFCQLVATGEKLRVIGNLPYNISTPLLFHLMAHKHCIQDIHVMLQKEVVERIVAAPGSSDYGRLSVMMQYHCQAEYLFTVRPGAFTPVPKVDSAVVRLQPYSAPPVEVHRPEVFASLVRQAFSQRRKTLRNSLRNMLDAEAIQAAGVDPVLRPEQLSLDQFAKLANLCTE